jgi:microcystin-dependent protein
MIDSYIGVIVPWAGTYAPQGWYFCWGQKIAITSNQALYATIFNTYGGDQKTYFNLPDLRTRIPRGAGAGPGLTAVKAGDRDGTAGVNTLSNVPLHTHTAGGTVTVSLNATTNTATVATPSAANVLAKPKKGMSSPAIYYTGNAPGTLDIGQLTLTGPAASGVTGTTGNPPGSVATYDSTPPLMDVNYIICYDGLYAPRNN